MKMTCEEFVSVHRNVMFLDRQTLLTYSASVSAKNGYMVYLMSAAVLTKFRLLFDADDLKSTKIPSLLSPIALVARPEPLCISSATATREIASASPTVFDARLLH